MGLAQGKPFRQQSTARQKTLLIVRRRHSDCLKYGKTIWRLALRPGPCWGSLLRSPDPIAVGAGTGCPYPKNPIPAVGPSGL